MCNTTISPSLRSHFINLYSMMMADLEVSPLERAELYRIGKDEFGLSSEELDNLVISDEILFFMPENETNKILYLYDMALMAWADGKIVDDEKELLKKTMKKFGIIDSEVDSLAEFLLTKAQEKLTHEQLLKEFGD